MNEQFYILRFIFNCKIKLFENLHATNFIASTKHSTFLLFYMTILCVFKIMKNINFKALFYLHEIIYFNAYYFIFNEFIS